MPATVPNSEYKWNNLVHFDKYLLSDYKRIKISLCLSMQCVRSISGYSVNTQCLIFYLFIYSNLLEVRTSTFAKILHCS